MTENTVARSRAHSHISRRRVVQGAAWSVPAVLVATAAPAFAGSDPNAYPILLQTNTGYVPNPGESQQHIELTLQRQDNNSTHDIQIVSVSVYFTQDNNGQFKESLGVSNDTSTWTYNAGASTMPTTVGGSGIAVFNPVGGPLVLSGSSATTLDFNINRFESIEKIVIEAYTGPSWSVNAGYEVVPVKLKK
ncbi:hypothetical protein QQX10_08470 [Demequina sp. SYSU T00039]|uniref:DUF4352 domain-containing protein n=1 Tax=Demequina lignilytica TaxID=3051663 RepID=A0AAW7M357_9MICO|nr:MULTISPECIES: hypothetical protein [unclassified Demequina]MDN4477450.1 hypothetical protein [Demequina sp. SYSU T00039-1]MDN4488199.1 hypothetical protein [Demequina sp. SYSU T00039]